MSKRPRKRPRPHRVTPTDQRYSSGIRAAGYPRGSGAPPKGKSVKQANTPIKVTKEGYYYNFPPQRFFIIRPWNGNHAHFYPRKDLDLPRGFNSRKEAENHIQSSPLLSDRNMRIVTGKEASKYLVPKRY